MLNPKPFLILVYDFDMVMHVSLLVMFETVDKISTKPLKSIGSHMKFYPHWKCLLQYICTQFKI